MVIYTQDLYHSGVKGMRWGTRKHHDKYGRLTKGGSSKRMKLQKEFDELTETPTITTAGKKRVTDIQKQYQALTGTTISKRASADSIKKTKSVHGMSNEELKAYNERKRLETDYKKYANPEQMSLGKKFTAGTIKRVIQPVAVEVGRAYLYGAVGMTLPTLAKLQGRK